MFLSPLLLLHQATSTNTNGDSRLSAHADGVLAPFGEQRKLAYKPIYFQVDPPRWSIASRITPSVKPFIPLAQQCPRNVTGNQCVVAKGGPGHATVVSLSRPSPSTSPSVTGLSGVDEMMNE